MSIGNAIVLTLLATTMARVGIVLLKQAVADVLAHQVQGFFRLAVGLARSGRGLSGVGLEIAGYGLFLLALSDPSAPISILQPLRAFGIVVMAFLSVVFLNERLQGREWLGIGLQLIGMILLGVTPPANGVKTIAAPSLLLFWAALAVIAGACVGLLLSSDKQGHAEFCFGVLAGILLGIAYLHTKVFFMAWQDDRTALIVLSVVAMPAGAVGGLAVLLWSFRSCRALVVTTINFVLNQVIVIVGGALCLGESFPEDRLRFAARVLGIVCILLGVVLLARFQEARTPIAAAKY